MVAKENARLHRCASCVLVSVLWEVSIPDIALRLARRRWGGGSHRLRYAADRGARRGTRVGSSPRR